ncbi:hypothetical protein B5S28_g4179 [[Candida] boidinii]|uniref:Unnamed protein product n=1 Tax=Candida boidinii TaxID=5477 RepID=A0ACB5TNW9_CANBO|nr:hypothetical protein B5S28_g4179 [[Candida] boidinii]OWB63791.1 hypothetical protein B5S29_g4801 [[Candida] boidinii]OWB74711.1 hypothetical protein B5S31_g4527 [[Candida] boidinii]OWB80302.1 hypothetical protein B5S32_g4566 [[Candida] boidinii]GME92029.1 unnamed protein product [[Candida] boidinii]
MSSSEKISYLFTESSSVFGSNFLENNNENYGFSSKKISPDDFDTFSQSTNSLNENINNANNSNIIDDDAYTTQRGLKARHIQLIALGGGIGTGLFVGSGIALKTCGPAPLLISYLIISFFVWCIMNELGEMVTYLPTEGRSTMYALCERYTGNRSFCFAAGLNLVYAQMLLVPAEISAAAFVVEYWTDLNVAIFISIFCVSTIGLNFLAVNYFGEVEFWIASIKILCILGLIIVGIVIFFGGAPASNGVLGFHYWNKPGAFNDNYVEGDTGRFLAVITALIKSAFAFILTPELITSCASESCDPRINLPKATKRFIYRIITFYICGVIVIGCIVGYDDPSLAAAIDDGKSGAAASPFVIGIQNAGIKILNHIVNACILTSAYSAGNSFLFSGSRTLYSMALSGDVPKIFARCNKYGVPYMCVYVGSLISLLAYLNVSNSSAKVFTWLSNISTVSGFISWICVAITYLRFRIAIDYHGLNDRITYRPPIQKIGAYSSIVFFSLLSLVNGYGVFFDWNTSDFIAAYITLPIFLILYLGHMFLTGNYRIFASPEEIDCTTGLKQIEELHDEYTKPEPKNIIERIWMWIV